MKNRQWLLARRPRGAIQDSDFNFVEAGAQPDAVLRPPPLRPKFGSSRSQASKVVQLWLGYLIEEAGGQKIVAAGRRSLEASRAARDRVSNWVSRLGDPPNHLI